MGSGFVTQELSLVLCDKLEGCAGVGGERGSKEGGLCRLRADSRGCMAETNTTLESNYLPIKQKIKRILGWKSIPGYLNEPDRTSF